jgi:ATP-binding cassette subfamily F protein uup
MNIISGRIKPDSGTVEIGDTVKIGYYSQDTAHMDEDLRVIEYIKEGAEYISTGDGSKITASQMLERFLFPPSQQWTPIAKLSGGERRRLYLLRVLMEAPNVLLLDEPTNDLDIETLTILEDYLESFEGAVIAVSHDRYFLDRIAERIFAFEGNGRIVQYTGNYSDFKENREAEDKSISDADKANSKNKPSSTSNREPRREKKLKLTYKEQKEYETIDDDIAALEERIGEVEAKINDSSSDYTLLQELLAEKEDLEKQLEEKMERWVYLNELVEKIEKGSGE